MTIEQQLKERSNGQCELSGRHEVLHVFAVTPKETNDPDGCIYISGKCVHQIEKEEDLDASFWTFLKDSMWSTVPAVQVVSWRMLNRLKHESWAADLIDMMYLDDETLAWAQASGDHLDIVEDVHKDANGVTLRNGDNIVLTQSLDVKGSQVNARIGTTVKSIKLVANNTEQIEGKVDGQQIVILTKYVRRQG